MKKLANIFLLAAALIISACEGPVGPPGLPGEDGYNFIGTVFEMENIDFNSGNGYSVIEDFPSNVTVYNSDVVLVYILWEQDNGLDVWRLMPQTVVLDEGVIQYNYDYTLENVRVFLEFTIPEEQLQAGETDNQIFRVAILPAEFASRKDVDINDINTVINAPNIQMKDLGTLDVKTNIMN
ncbi:hypothetical protein [Maribellus sp. YY47]|uniref:hypothetical protein n=1 Tax=Maribellus sp. YY47 TaxID=2929486 RepID=UPI002001BD90|nr:hypothetical protein [Maribellus sp. YY47]MCK3683550.1 hypothetical protein [Maribellus sp. YY47]